MEIFRTWEYYYDHYLNAQKRGDTNDMKYFARACNGIRILNKLDRPTLGGFTLSDEEIANISKHNSGEGNGMFGADRNGEENPMWGKKHSNESKEKNSKSHAHEYVKCHDGDGKVFDSVRMASIHHNIKYSTAKFRVNNGSKGWGRI